MGDVLEATKQQIVVILFVAGMYFWCIYLDLQIK